MGTCVHHWLIVDHIGRCIDCNAKHNFLPDTKRNLAIADHTFSNRAVRLRQEEQERRVAKYGGIPGDIYHLPWEPEDADWLERSSQIENMMNVAGRSRR